MKKKIFVLDTNVLVHDPEAFLQFPRHEVILPVTVLEELDNLKRIPGEVGKNVRLAIRTLCALKNGKGDFHKGLSLKNGATIRVVTEIKGKYPSFLNPDLNDNKILMTALDLADKHRVVFVSKDLALRIKAEALGLETEDYERLKVSYESIHRECRSLTLEKRAIDMLFKEGELEIEEETVQPNEYVQLTDGYQTACLAWYDGGRQKLKKLVPFTNLWGVKPRNLEQQCAVDALLREEIRLVTLVGPAGTGKTLLALAAGLKKVFDDGTYRKILVSRPIVPLGRDIGFLPGTKEEKLSHWMQPIFDNLELLCASHEEESDTLNWVLENKKIEMEAVTYIRGRSLPKMYFLIDEAQNLTPHEVKTIISRAGEGTKVILVGDPTQIDNPYLDKDSNGLTYAFAKFSDQNISASVFLDKTERSELASLAAELL